MNPLWDMELCRRFWRILECEGARFPPESLLAPAMDSICIHIAGAEEEAHELKYCRNTNTVFLFVESTKGNNDSKLAQPKPAWGNNGVTCKCEWETFTAPSQIWKTDLHKEKQPHQKYLYKNGL